MSGDKGALLRAERLAAIERIGRLAHEHQAQFVLIAGDLFDAHTVDNEVLTRALEILGRFTMPVYAIPGNHDFSAAPESVYRRDRFRERCPETLHILSEAKPIELTDHSVILLPCPLVQRHTVSDPTRWLSSEKAATAESFLRIGIAHGSVVDFESEEGGTTPNLIDPGIVVEARLDYLALGDWHGVRRINDRSWYSGTPEPDRFKQKDAGYVLLVEIEGSGATPRVTPLRSAGCFWLMHNAILHEDNDVVALERWFAELEHPQQTLVQIEIEGVLGMAAIERLERLLNTQHELLLHLRQRGRGVQLKPSQEELDALGREGLTGRVAERLRAMVDQGGNEADAVDFGDLVLHAAALVEHNDGVKQYITGFKHVLVDEYQDVNFASAKLLRAMRAAGAEVWVVADQRQSIYRFRGAEPSNVTRFTEEFDGRWEPLSTNYRSVAPIVKTFEHFTGSMGDGRSMRGRWTAKRAEGGSVSRIVAPNITAEAEAIRDKIETFRKAGVPYCDQAILARTHLTLARLADVLEQINVPLLYLGDLFEREEIRDLLSLVSLGAEFGGVGLVRVAQLPNYGASREDVMAVLGWARSGGMSVFDALDGLSEIAELSDAGRAGLAKLGVELKGLAYVSAWTMLTTWLFDRSEYLRPLLDANDRLSQQKLVAIYHLLKVCSEQDLMGDISRSRFLARIRRIEALNQDGAYRTLASEATDIDAVRVMTIHGSKGLEFRAVHFPALATRYTPASQQGTRCPPPPTLPHLAMEKEHHDAEEECLFFVGVSRARDHLSLSRAERYTKQQSKPSKFLDLIPSGIREQRFDGSGQTFSLPVHYHPPEPREHYPERDLDLYLRCPARYRYEVIDRLAGSSDKSAYARFHRCVYRTIDWLHHAQNEGRPIDVASALKHLTEEWDAHGPSEHPFAGYYRRTADAMVTRMVELIVANQSDQYAREEWIIALEPGSVLLTPDRVLLTPQGMVRVQRIRTGRESESEMNKPIYALLRRGAKRWHPGANVVVETFYLATGKAVPVLAKQDDKRIQRYADAIEAVERGEFTPAPDPQTCPTCPFYFMCGA